MAIKRLKMKYWLLGVLIVFMFHGTNAQDPKRFQKEIEVLTAKEYNFDPTKELVVFAGSSSIKLWKDVQDAFPEYNVINNGFGGSQFSDMIFYYDEVIRQPQPDILFIYEGDNDVATGKDPKNIIKEARQVVKQARNDLPEAKIVIISAKPSVARNEFKQQYMELNRRLEKFARRTRNVEFADVWNAMVDENGDVYTDIFADDNLHLNKKGYEIWTDVISRHLPKASVSQ